MRTLILALVAASLAGCVRDPDPFEFVEPSLSVHGLVIAGDDEVHVSILPGHGNVGEPQHVSVAGAGGTVALTPTTRDSTCYHAYAPPTNADRVSCFRGTLSAPVAPGSNWALHVTAGDGEVVTGETRVPATPEIVRPADRERIAYGQPTFLDVEWQTDGAPRVEVNVGEGIAYRGGQLVPNARCMAWGPRVDAAVGQPAGTRRVRLEEVYCSSPTVSPVAWDSVVVPLLVTAYDSAYAEFALHGESVIRGHRGASLRGAYGVFGSAAYARRDVVIVR